MFAEVGCCIVLLALNLVVCMASNSHSCGLFLQDADARRKAQPQSTTLPAEPGFLCPKVTRQVLQSKDRINIFLQGDEQNPILWAGIDCCGRAEGSRAALRALILLHTPIELRPFGKVHSEVVWSSGAILCLPDPRMRPFLTCHWHFSAA